MISDEERREVAERLRILASHAPTDKDYVLDALGLYPGEYIDGFDPYCVNELADLIDPTCFDTESNDSKSFTCSACGFSESKLVVNPFTLSFSWVKPSYRYCPECGAEVVSADD